MKLGEIIKIYIEEHQISLREFARNANLSNTYISNIAKGEDKNPSIDSITKIARAMNTTSQQLFEKLDDEQSFKMNGGTPYWTKIPLYSHISCGHGLFIDDEIEDYIAVPDKYINPNQTYFANTASGDSMIGKNIKDGDVLVFEQTNILINGEVGSFCVDDNEAVCKIFRKLDSGIILLESANDKYDPIMIDVTNECFRIIGRYRFKFSIEQ